MSRLSFDHSVRILSWIGDLLLIGTALTLLFMRGDVLTPGMTLVLVLAIFLGGLLPISVHFLDYLMARNATRAAEATAPESLRRALEQIDHLVTRVETSAADASKTSISARQVPALIESRTEAITDAAQRLEGILSKLGDWSEPLPQPAPGTGDSSASAPQAMETLLADFRDSLDTALAARGRELEALAERLSAIEEALRDRPQSAVTNPAVSPEFAESDRDTPPETTSTPKAKAETRTATKRTRKKKAARKKPTAAEPPAPPPAAAAPARAEVQLFEEESLPKALPDGQAALVVKALVGVNNRIYARGDPPLSWDIGRPLDPTGIGEWRLDLSEVSETLKVEIRLNDEIAAKGSPAEIHSGRITRASPVFPPANEPF